MGSPQSGPSAPSEYPVTTASGDGLLGFDTVRRQWPGPSSSDPSTTR